MAEPPVAVTPLSSYSLFSCPSNVRKSLVTTITMQRGHRNLYTSTSPMAVACGSVLDLTIDKPKKQTSRQPTTAKVKCQLAQGEPFRWGVLSLHWVSTVPFDKLDEKGRQRNVRVRKKLIHDGRSTSDPWQTAGELRERKKQQLESQRDVTAPTWSTGNGTSCQIDNWGIGRT